jgi:hypothetical protein
MLCSCRAQRQDVREDAEGRRDAVMQAAAEENVKAGFVKEKQSAEFEPEVRVQLVDERGE